MNKKDIHDYFVSCLVNKLRHYLKLNNKLETVDLPYSNTDLGLRLYIPLSARLNKGKLYKVFKIIESLKFINELNIYRIPTSYTISPASIAYNLASNEQQPLTVKELEAKINFDTFTFEIKVIKPKDRPLIYIVSLVFYKEPVLVAQEIRRYTYESLI